VNLEQLAALCRQAATDLAGRTAQRPVPATVVLPLPEATAVTTLEDFPDDDEGRFELLARFAADRMVPVNAPCFGFIAEATLDDDGIPVDVVVCVWGARRRGAQLTAAPITAEGVGEFVPPEPLDPTAMPFLAPLQHAADTAREAGP